MAPSIAAVVLARIFCSVSYRNSSSISTGPAKRESLGTHSWTVRGVLDKTSYEIAS